MQECDGIQSRIPSSYFSLTTGHLYIFPALLTTVLQFFPAYAIRLLAFMDVFYERISDNYRKAIAEVRKTQHLNLCKT